MLHEAHNTVINLCPNFNIFSLPRFPSIWPYPLYVYQTTEAGGLWKKKVSYNLDLTNISQVSGLKTSSLHTGFTIFIISHDFPTTTETGI